MFFFLFSFTLKVKGQRAAVCLPKQREVTFSKKQTGRSKQAARKRHKGKETTTAHRLPSALICARRPRGRPRDPRFWALFGMLFATVAAFERTPASGYSPASRRFKEMPNISAFAGESFTLAGSGAFCIKSVGKGWRAVSLTAEERRASR